MILTAGEQCVAVFDPPTGASVAAKPDPLDKISAAEHGEKRYVLHPKDDDVFVRTGEQIIYACQLNISYEVWKTNFEDMLEEVGEWVATRTTKIQDVRVELRTDKIMIFIVPHTPQFDFELAAEMTDLDIRLVRNYNVGWIETLQVPAVELSRFVGHNASWSFKGFGQRDSTPAHHPMEA